MNSIRKKIFQIMRDLEANEESYFINLALEELTSLAFQARNEGLIAHQSLSDCISLINQIVSAKATEVNQDLMDVIITSIPISWNTLFDISSQKDIGDRVINTITDNIVTQELFVNQNSRVDAYDLVSWLCQKERYQAAQIFIEGAIKSGESGKLILSSAVAAIRHAKEHSYASNPSYLLKYEEMLYRLMSNKYIGLNFSSADIYSFCNVGLHNINRVMVGNLFSQFEACDFEFCHAKYGVDFIEDIISEKAHLEVSASPSEYVVYLASVVDLPCNFDSLRMEFSHQHIDDYLSISLDRQIGPKRQVADYILDGLISSPASWLYLNEKNDSFRLGEDWFHERFLKALPVSCESLRSLTFLLSMKASTRVRKASIREAVGDSFRACFSNNATMDEVMDVVSNRQLVDIIGPDLVCECLDQFLLNSNSTFMGRVLDSALPIVYQHSIALKRFRIEDDMSL